eukprot:TRINITY_DN115_c0_g3_i1.p1 TRINITY_DN115_c0_g3~~TRINITY_DN115_c0_g3_i1.p1  ORF type:complete len:248 (-),score=48.36 TRINITY_DN115_c0_g3_i1:334-1077(-)
MNPQILLEPPGAYHKLPARQSSKPITHTQYPTLTGGTVLALKYRDGVAVYTDTLASYGNMARFMDFQRAVKINDETLLAAQGDLSDFQEVLKKAETLSTEMYSESSGKSIAPRELYCYLSRWLYNRRNKFDPLWNNFVVAGNRNGKSFLGVVDIVGTCYEEDIVATGMGLYFAITILRKEYKPDMTFEEASALLRKAALVQYYRDKSTIDKWQLSTVTAEGVTIRAAEQLETNWDVAEFVTHFASLK